MNLSYMSAVNTEFVVRFVVLTTACTLPCGIFGCKALLIICGRLCVVYLLCSCGVYSLLFAVSRRGELIVAHTLVSFDTGDDTQSDNAAVVYHGYCKTLEANTDRMG